MRQKQRTPAKAQPSQDVLPLATVFEALRDSSRPPGSLGINAHTVQEALGLRSLYLAERLLVALGGAERRFETPEEFVAVAQRMMMAPLGAKVAFLFRLHDENGDGYLHRSELEKLLHIGLAENSLKLSEGEADKLVQVLMDAGDRNRDNYISREEFIDMMAAHPTIQRRLAEYGVSLLMPGKRARKMTLVPGSPWSGWVRNGVVLATWLSGYLVVNALLFLEAFLEYRAAGASLYIQIARGCGACLNLNGALIAVPMLRQSLTWVRRSFLGAIVPVDDAVGIHAFIGEAMVVLSIVHGGAHVLNLWPAPSVGSIPVSLANATGVALLVVISLMWLFSRSFVRRSGHFEVFHVTHLGYFAVVALLFAHGPNFWVWGTAPWLWFLVERFFRARRRSRTSRVLDAHALTSGVTRLDLERPAGFRYTPGDYVFLRVPIIAHHEWHPLTLTSAPEDPRQLSVHIRSVGNWTAAVREHLPDIARAGGTPRVHVDGPYGSASRHILEVPHAVAIAAGIGVTPFASILQSLLLSRTAPDSPRAPLQKLRFVWLCREQESFEWFRDLLAELEAGDHEELLDIHIFMTAARGDMAGSVLDLAQDVLHSRREGDIVTGLRTRTTLGSPDIDRLLEGFYKNPHLPRPQVFFCGPDALGRTVARSCRRLGLRFRRERF